MLPLNIQPNDAQTSDQRIAIGAANTELKATDLSDSWPRGSTNGRDRGERRIETCPSRSRAVLNNDRPPVPALERALTILECLASTRNGMSFAELAHRLGLAKSSTHVLLSTLERRGYIERAIPSRRYRFGLKLFSLANMAIAGVSLRDEARPYLQALMEKTKLTVHMAILDHDEAVLIEKVEPPGLIKLATWIGKRMDLHCTSLGKALLAHVPEKELDPLLGDRGLPKHNRRTIGSPRKLKQELRRIRKSGYATDDEEDEIGLRCVGVPVFNREAQVIAAISVAGLVSRLPLQRIPSIATVVKETATALSRHYGFSPSIGPVVNNVSNAFPHTHQV